MKRFIDQELLRWKENAVRKPLLMRGARQVGKTYSVRQLAKSFTNYLEVNFESDRSVQTFFERDLNPDEICSNLSAYYNVPVQDGQTLLFLDEIQSCPNAISALRFFMKSGPGCMSSQRVPCWSLPYKNSLHSVSGGLKTFLCFPSPSMNF